MCYGHAIYEFCQIIKSYYSLIDHILTFISKMYTGVHMTLRIIFNLLLFDYFYVLVHEISVFIASANSEGSDESSHMRRLV